MQPPPSEESAPTTHKPAVYGAVAKRKAQQDAEVKEPEDPDQPPQKVWDRVNTIRPKTPKVPFATTLSSKKIEEIPPDPQMSKFLTKWKNRLSHHIFLWLMVTAVLLLLLAFACLEVLFFLKFL